MALEISGDVLDIRPGDTLLLTTSFPMSMAQEERIRAEVEERMPGVTVVCVGPVSGAAVYHADRLEVADTDLLRGTALGG